MKGKQKSFLDEFLRIKKADGICVKDRSKGFRYLHRTITKRMAEGKDFKIGDLDFSKFTEDDISDYFKYYGNNLEPIAYEVKTLFYQITNDIADFPLRRQYRGALR